MALWLVLRNYCPLGFDHQLGHTEAFFLIYAVRQSPSDEAVVSDLAVFEFYPLEISINFVMYSKRTLFLTGMDEK